MPLPSECQNPLCFFSFVNIFGVQPLADALSDWFDHEGERYVKCPLCRGFNLVAADHLGRLKARSYHRVLPPPANRAPNACQNPSCAHVYKPRLPEADDESPEFFLITTRSPLGIETFLRCPLCGALNFLARRGPAGFSLRGFRPPIGGR